MSGVKLRGVNFSIRHCKDIVFANSRSKLNQWNSQVSTGCLRYKFLFSTALYFNEFVRTLLLIQRYVCVVMTMWEKQIVVRALKPKEKIGVTTHFSDG